MQSEEIFQTIPEWAQSSQEHQRKKATNHVTLTWKFPWKSCPTTHLPFLSSNSKILKAFWKIFPPKWSLLNAQQKKRNEARKAKKKGRRESEETAMSLFNPISKLCFLCMVEPLKLIFYIWLLLFFPWETLTACEKNTHPHQEQDGHNHL